MSGDLNYCNISTHVHFYNNYKQMYQDHMKQCPSLQGCKQAKYVMLGRSSPKPKGKGNKIKPTEVRIEFYKPIVEYYIEEISYDFQSLIGEVGGTMGLTVGLSFLSIFDWMLDYFKKYVI